MKLFLTVLFYNSFVFAESIDQSQRIVSVFNELNINNMHILKDFYDENIKFEDPLVSLNNLESLQKHYENMYKNVKKIEFIFGDIIHSEEKYSTTWIMNFSTDSLNSGETISVPGTSILHFKNNKVIYHRDYFDMGKMVYKYIPVMKWFVKYIESQYN